MKSQNTYFIFVQENYFENVAYIMADILYRPRCVNSCNWVAQRGQLIVRGIMAFEIIILQCVWWFFITKLTDIFQTTFSNAFSWMEIVVFRWKFYWNLFHGVQLTILQHWFWKWLPGAGQATRHYLNQWWLSLMTHICVTRPQWINTIKRPQRRLRNMKSKTR